MICLIQGGKPLLMPDSIKDHVTFHPICIGDPVEEAGKSSKNFKTLQQVMNDLGHERITLLKVS